MIYSTAVLLFTAVAMASPLRSSAKASFKPRASRFLSKLRSKDVASRTAVNADLRVDLPLGATAPAPYFDPLGLSKDADAKTIQRWREAELTHGRVSMLSALGFLTAENFHPLFGGDINGPAIDHFQQIDDKYPGFWKALLFSISLFESYRSTYGWSDPTQGGDLFTLKDTYTPGDLNFDPLKVLDDKTPEEIQELKNKELNNGRLAMIALAGIIAQELVNHETVVDTWRQILNSEEKAALSLTDTDFKENVKNIDPKFLTQPEMKYNPEEVGKIIQELPKL
mmetsp:Transcript_18342/g.27463  ORF Transcript_18342/g.27463 Transcript_18342/m.27463 type:complete len:282 (+) Transcript_18342:84-929(+)|eukprot:CAMPEP_0167751894 /NCGR_PEP_ID=MMETSP0110_2-20121227/6830_1 /TAXON_ID=629695 /ORGANISM="Gymnochlora sp., Strain CCMP2014" /LENGTH=281 /DNA_ID=CAMNT_0007637437 /DNA_START=67 /DNA_END=912 /DNA_ORIENTATION=+